MATNSRLIKDWIQYLKGLQIVAGKSDPDTGKLNYKRKVTSDDVIHFLEVKTNFNEEEISNAVHMVLAKKAQGGGKPKLQNKPTPKEPGKDVSTWMHNEITPIQRGTDVAPGSAQAPREPAKQIAGPKNAPGKIAHDPDSVTDVEYRDIPNEPEAPKSRKKSWLSKFGGKRGLREDIQDDAGYELDENDVEQIFNILTSGKADVGKSSEEPEQDPEEKKQSEIETLKDVISNTMSSSQRKAFWNALHDDPLMEATASRDEIEQIFRDAIGLQARSSLKKSNIDIDDLHKVWKAAHFPGDTDKIGRILYSQGFDGQTIDRVFSDVLGDEYESDNSDKDNTKPSPALAKIIDYVKQNGYQKELIAFMQEKFGDELTAEPEQEKPGMFKRAANFGKKMFGRKVTTEEVRKIFTAILREERTERHRLIREIEQSQLGRSKKQLDEIVSLNDVLKADSFVTLMKAINTKIGTDINVTRIKNQVLQSWKKGMKSRKHYDKLLSQIDISLNDLIK